MIHSVAVLGAGAVGFLCYLGISALDDVELGVIAEGERAERIRREDVLSMIRFIARRCGRQRKQRKQIY